MVGRLLAALSYVGLTGALAPLAQPDNRYVVRHARLALLLHLLRVALVIPALLWPLAGLADGARLDAIPPLAASLSLLAVLGVALPITPAGLGPWVVGVLTATWALDIFGFVIALGGLTADWHAFFHADWPNVNQSRFARRQRDPAEILREKEQLAQLREGRLARVRQADTVAARERQRYGTVEGLRAEFDDATARRAHLTELLRLGEISKRRYGEQAGQLDARLTELATQIAVLGARRMPLSELDGRRRRELPTDILVHAPLQTLAITARSGVPLCTYGNFRLDEALVTGILSAFNSISEEVFGAEVHKTELAEGQVLTFVHARWTVTMAVFEEDPSPMQLRLLRDMVDEFERVNALELGRAAPNPARLREVHVPFSFAAAPAMS
ncbi:MAG TPA: hypothetical protein VFW96_26635 [Thermomicrobiales bacterium]|nr:hypothetical protein [Thermomicrobiales bacterium]